MNDAKLLVREGDVTEFYDVLNANFGGNVTDYMEAALRVLSTVLFDREVAMDINGRLESIVELLPLATPHCFVETYPFQKTNWVNTELKALSMHSRFENQDESSIFYSSSYTYQKLVEQYLDGANFVHKETGTALDLSFGGVLDLVPIFEGLKESVKRIQRNLVPSYGTKEIEDGFVERIQTWMKLGENNCYELVPSKIDAMARKMYQNTRTSKHPRKEIFKMYWYQNKFNKHRYIRLVST